MNIYVASSWRNLLQPAVVSILRNCGHTVYDFRQHGFAWRDVAPDWQNWTPEQYEQALKHPLAVAGFERDMKALKECDACILVLPSGRSASFEFGYAIGQGKIGAVVLFDSCEPELMYSGQSIIKNSNELLTWGGFDK